VWGKERAAGASNGDNPLFQLSGAGGELVAVRVHTQSGVLVKIEGAEIRYYSLDFSSLSVGLGKS